MSESNVEKDATPEINVQRLATWMDEQKLPGSGEPLTLARLGGGSQNDLFVVERSGERSVLRTPPVAADAKRHDGLRRELQLLRALKGTEVPHAELLAGSEGTDVLGRPFYLMNEVRGWSPTSAGWPVPHDSDLEARKALGFGLVEGAALLSKVDWKARGLENFGRPDGFHDRQVDRWLAFLKKYEFREIPGLEEASAWLRTHRPRQWEPGIMHGDYQFANLMFSNDVPAKLAAVIDWEMTTIGDPLLDLGWALIAWSPEGDDMTASRYLNLDGMPPRDDLLEHYEKISGRSTEDIDYYVILARWKLAIVLEMSYARYVASPNPDPQLASFGDMILELMRKAAELSRATTGVRSA